MEDGKLTPLIMSERHNCDNVKEVERLLAEHPNEENVILHGAVLSVVRITRGT